MNAATTRPAYRGWRRDSAAAPWRPVAEGPDADACLGATLKTLAGSPGGDFVVLPAGQDPNATGRRPARRRLP